MIARLGTHLELVPREQNELLLAAGFAPAFTALALESEEMASVRAALRRIVTANEPFPAHVVDRGWNIVESNAGFGIFSLDADPFLLEAPVNALRLALHPKGMRPRILNFGEWSHSLLARLGRRVTLTGDPALAALYREVVGYAPHDPGQTDDAPELMVPLRIRYRDDELALFCTIATFGTPLDVTVSELAIETFLPADPETTAILQRLDHQENRARSS
ncbi:transcriptional regulator [Gryllotalpicola protaetiae]|nr:transcriptional regulator [Gryllotalpicola protaetiae]